MRKFLLFLLPIATSFTAVYGDVTLPPLISDNMLLQKPMAAVWGKADPGEQVTVKLGAVSAKTTANKDGKWRVKLEGLKSGIVGEMTISGKNKLTIQNVAVGDVWVCSGQSNMQMSLAKTDWNKGAINSEQEIAAANYPGIRMFTVPRKTSTTPLEEVDGKWEVCSPGTVGPWSATGYFFGRQLHQDLHLPIGLIHTSWGGTPAQSWTPAEVLQGDPEFKANYWDKAQEKFLQYPTLIEVYNKETLPAWQAAVDAAKAEGKPAPRKPIEPLGPNSQYAPSRLFNGMLLGATKYSIKGAIWYQGESNASDAAGYRRLLPAMINAWRKEWKQGEFPFYIVQLANYMARRAEPTDSNWANLRDAQRVIALKVPNTGLAVAIDIGDEKDIHPRNKQEVGRRLALAAEAKTYGKEIVFSGPWFDKASFDGANVKISFKPGTALGMATPDGGEIKGFAIAGEDKKFVWATAKIVPAGVPAKGSKAGKSKAAEPTLLLTSPEVAKPVAVRYAWANSPEVNLVNKAGLPAVPFRTDDWPQVEPPPIPAAPAATPAPTPVAVPAPAATPTASATATPAPQ